MITYNIKQTLVTNLILKLWVLFSEGGHVSSLLFLSSLVIKFKMLKQYKFIVLSRNKIKLKIYYSLPCFVLIKVLFYKLNFLLIE